MLTIFSIFTMAIATATVGHNEGGFEAIKEKGFTEAISQAWEDREQGDYSKTND